MVRLVFRPYTHIWRTICTSVSLRASTRVSTGFTLYRHSSPSFGYQQICYHSNQSPRVMIGWWCTLPPWSFRVPTWADRICLYFHCAFRFSTLRLAYMLDSLVRVSRRVWWAHLISESRDLKNNEQLMHTKSNRNFRKSANLIVRHKSSSSFRQMPRSCFPPSSKRIYTVKSHPPEWRLPRHSFIPLT